VIRLYRARFSTNVERVTLALALKGVEGVDSVWIDYGDRSLVERVSGQPLVPVLDYDGEILAGSMDIVHEVERRHPAPRLYPDDPTEVLAFIQWFDGTWKGPPNRIEAELGKEEPDQALIGEFERSMVESLDRFEHMLTDGDYLIGDTLTAADICAFPFLKFATLHDPDDGELFHLILRDRQRDGRARPRLAAWIERMDVLPRA
jgi:glutathione S-transferase